MSSLHAQQGARKLDFRQLNGSLARRSVQWQTKNMSNIVTSHKLCMQPFLSESLPPTVDFNDQENPLECVSVNTNFIMEKKRQVEMGKICNNTDPYSHIPGSQLWKASFALRLRGKSEALNLILRSSFWNGLKRANLISVRVFYCCFSFHSSQEALYQ